MAVLKYALRDVVRLLQEAAKNRSVVTYSDLWRACDAVEAEHDRWDTLAEAVDRICAPREAIYGALMSAKGSDLPGNGFYRLFREARNFDYVQLVGDVEWENLTEAQKRLLTDSERQNVFKHAIS